MYIIYIYVYIYKVLLEGFLNAITDIENQERNVEAAREYNKMAGPLDPLIATLANFHSEEHLAAQVL